MTRTVSSILGLVLATVSLAAFAQESEPWYSLYEKGLDLVERGRGEEAYRILQEAVAKRPEPELMVATEGLRYIDYLPQLYLAVAAHMQGDLGTARSHLRASEAAGVAGRSDAGRTLLAAYRILLRAEPADGTEAARADEPPPDSGSRPAYADFPRRPEVLPEAEVVEIERELKVRCGLPPTVASSSAPWYFHYELALEMDERGDPQRALDALVAATERRAEPRQGARMYGMWFIDYLPYYHLAKTHAELGNWACAFDALLVSERKGEITPEDDEFTELAELKEKVDRHLDPP